MNIFTVDLKGIQTKRDLISKFYEVFKLPEESMDNWDALNDWMRSLDSDSLIISQMNPIPEHIHLIIKNYNEAKKLDVDYPSVRGNLINDYEIFNDILISWTDNSPEVRGEGSIVNIKITFEVHHGDY